MTDKELIEELKRYHIDDKKARTDGSKSLFAFFAFYFREMNKKYKSYKPLFEMFMGFNIDITLTPAGIWYYEHTKNYDAITKTLDKKIKSIMTELGYKYLYDL